MVGDKRQGWAILAAMGVLFIAGVAGAYWAEAAGNPQFAGLGLDPANMEGKEVCFGVEYDDGSMARLLLPEATWLRVGG